MLVHILFQQIYLFSKQDLILDFLKLLLSNFQLCSGVFKTKFISNQKPNIILSICMDHFSSPELKLVRMSYASRLSLHIMPPVINQPHQLLIQIYKDKREVCRSQNQNQAGSPKIGNKAHSRIRSVLS